MFKRKWVLWSNSMTGIKHDGKVHISAVVCTGGYSNSKILGSMDVWQYSKQNICSDLYQNGIFWSHVGPHIYYIQIKIFGASLQKRCLLPHDPSSTTLDQFISDFPATFKHHIKKGTFCGWGLPPLLDGRRSTLMTTLPPPPPIYASTEPSECNPLYYCLNR